MIVFIIAGVVILIAILSLTRKPKVVSFARKELKTKDALTIHCCEKCRDSLSIAGIPFVVRLTSKNIAIVGRNYYSFSKLVRNEI